MLWTTLAEKIAHRTVFKQTTATSCAQQKESEKNVTLDIIHVQKTKKKIVPIS